MLRYAPAYWIDVHGSLKIDSVKVTSWDPTTNYYAITNGSRTGSGVFIFGAPRPSIVLKIMQQAPQISQIQRLHI